MQGFLILNRIVGGQTLAAVSDKLNATLGIVIIGVISLLVRSTLDRHSFAQQ
jgi:purine-cytosine permease-like protein